MDAGNLLLYRHRRSRGINKSPQAVDAEERKRRLGRAQLLADVYARMKVQAVAVGPLDLALGRATLQTLVRQHRLPFMSANLQDARGRRLFPAGKLVTVAGVRIGLFAVTGEHAYQKNAYDTSEFKLGDPRQATTDQVKTLRTRGAQLIVGLAAVGLRQAHELAKAVPGIDFLLVSGSGRVSQRLERIGTAWVAEAGREGKYLGRLEIHIRGKQLTFEDMSERFNLAARIEQTRKSLERQKQRQTRLGDHARHAEIMNRRLERLQTSLGRLGQQLHQENQRQPKMSYITNVLVGIKATDPRDPEVARLMTAATQKHGLKRAPGAR